MLLKVTTEDVEREVLVAVASAETADAEVSESFVKRVVVEVDVVEREGVAAPCR